MSWCADFEFRLTQEWRRPSSVCRCVCDFKGLCVWALTWLGRKPAAISSARLTFAAAADTSLNDVGSFLSELLSAGPSTASTSASASAAAAAVAVAAAAWARARHNCRNVPNSSRLQG